MRSPAVIDRATLTLLLALARPVLAESAREPIQALARRLPGPAWARLADRALQTRTAPWILSHSDALRLPMPAAVRTELLAVAQDTLRRTLDCDQVRLQLAPWLRGPDAPLLLLKGRAIEARAYPAGVMRPTVDVDVLVRPGHARRMSQAFRQAGLQPLGPAGRHVRGWAAPGARGGVDVHQTIVDPLRFPVLGTLAEREALFTRSTTLARGQDQDMRVLEPLDQTAHLLLHLGTGLYADLRHLADTAQWLAFVQPNPQALAARLRHWQAVRAGRSALAAVRWFDPERAGKVATATLAALGEPDLPAQVFAVAARTWLQVAGQVHPRWLEALGLAVHVEHPAAFAVRSRHAWRRLLPAK